MYSIHVCPMSLYCSKRIRRNTDSQFVTINHVYRTVIPVITSYNFQYKFPVSESVLQYYGNLLNRVGHHS